MDVLRPVVELINFNLNVIKICGFPAFSMKKKNPSPEECCGSTFNSDWACCGLVLHSMKSLVGWFCHGDVVNGGGVYTITLMPVWNIVSG